MAHKPWTTVDRRTVSESRPLAPAEYRLRPAGKQRSRPVAQEHNALCSKHQRKGMGYPWLVTEAGGRHVAGLCNLPVLDIGAVVHLDSVSNVASSRVHPASPRPEAYLPRCRQQILQNEPRHPCVALCSRTRLCLPSSSRPRVLRLLIQKTLLGSAASSSLSKAETLETLPHSNPLQVANLALPHLKTKRM